MSRAPLLFWAATTCLLSVAAVVVFAETALMTRRGQDIDQSAMETVYAQQGTQDRLLSLLGNISLGTTTIALVVCVAAALWRRRYDAAVGAVVLVAGANLTTQLLKQNVLERPDLENSVLAGLPNSLPSGHTTVVTALVLAALLVAGARMRTFVGCLGGFAITFTGASTLVTGWHRPSDVLSGLAISLAWGAAVVFILGVRRPAYFHGSLWSQSGIPLLGAVAAGAVLIAVGVRPDHGWPGFVEAAAVLGLIGLASALTVAVFARLSSVHAR